MRRSRRIAVAGVGAAAVLLSITLALPTAAAWQETARFTAQTRVPPVAGPPTVDPPVNPPVNPPVEPPVEPPVTPPPSPDAFGPLAPAAGTVITEVAWEFPEINNQGTTCVGFVVTSDSPTAPWSFRFARQGAPMWGDTNLWPDSGAAVPDPDADDDDDFVFTRASWNHDQSQQVRLCMNPSVNPSVQEDRFDVELSALEWTEASATEDSACADLTVRGRVDAEFPFFFGWRAVIDLEEFDALFQAEGITPTRFVLTGRSGSFTSTPWSRDSDQVTLTSTTTGALRGGQEAEIRACLVG